MVPNVTGSITLNGLTDAEMARIWDMKAKYGETFLFSPNQMQVIPPNQPRPGYPPQPPAPNVTVYNNVVFHWNDTKGLEIVNEVMTYLLKKDEGSAAAQAQ